MRLNVVQWLLGWILAGIMIGVGVIHAWLWLWIGGLAFGVFWWVIPDLLALKDHQEEHDPPDDIR